jgi:hypothetical protein
VSALIDPSREHVGGRPRRKFRHSSARIIARTWLDMRGDREPRATCLGCLSAAGMRGALGQVPKLRAAYWTPPDLRTSRMLQRVAENWVPLTAKKIRLPGGLLAISNYVQAQGPAADAC